MRDKAAPALEESGINVCFDTLPDLPEDLSAPRRLIRHAFNTPKGADVLSDVFDAFFLHGRNIGDETVLTEIAGKNGLPEDCLSQCGIPDTSRFVCKEPLRAVPCLIFDRKTMIFGAQSVACLKNMLSLALRLRQEKGFEKL